MDGQGAWFKVWDYLLLKPFSYPFLSFPVSFEKGSLQPTHITVETILSGVINGNWKDWDLFTVVQESLRSYLWGNIFISAASCKLHILVSGK